MLSTAVEGSMGILKRLSNLMKSNANAAMDAAEDPKLQMEEALRQMDSILQSTRAQQVGLAAQMKLSEKQAAVHAQVAASWEDKAAAALKAGREDLARAALEEKSKADSQVTISRATADEHHAAVVSLGASITSLEERIAQTRSQQAQLLTRHAVATMKNAGGTQNGVLFKDKGGDGAMDTFDRMVGRIENDEAEVEASQAETATSAALSALDKDAGRPQVDDALAALKARMSKS